MHSFSLLRNLLLNAAHRVATRNVDFKLSLNNQLRSYEAEAVSELSNDTESSNILEQKTQLALERCFIHSKVGKASLIITDVHCSGPLHSP